VSDAAERIAAALRVLARETRRGRYAAAPIYQLSAETTPFLTLVGCLVSQRVRDQMTARICAELFPLAPTPDALLAIPRRRLESILRPGGFYRRKAEQLHNIARAVRDRGEVPRSREGLLALPGIGPKCANIVLASWFEAPVIAVDTHVHRIANRMGWVRSRTPGETEAALMRSVPPRWRRRVNPLLVAHGQTLCKPSAPRCPECPVAHACAKRGVRSIGALAAGSRSRHRKEVRFN
jgi:endonuclease-3